jgi:hypothetical protein
MLSKSKLSARRRLLQPGGLIPAQNHFTGLAGAHRVKAFLEVINAKRWVMIGDRSRPDWISAAILYQVSNISRP